MLGGPFNAEDTIDKVSLGMIEQIHTYLTSVGPQIGSISSEYQAQRNSLRHEIQQYIGAYEYMEEIGEEPPPKHFLQRT